MSAPGWAQLYDKDDNPIAKVSVNAGWCSSPDTHEGWIRVLYDGFADSKRFTEDDDYQERLAKLPEYIREIENEFQQNKHKWHHAVLWGVTVTREQLENWINEQQERCR